MKLSIVTINYNNAEGLKRTLDSVASQTYRDIEHIIIDAASTDGSVDIIKEYVAKVDSRESRVKSVVWVSEKDNGIYNAMNKGIEIALGRRVVNSFNRSEQGEDKFNEVDRPKQSGVENKVVPDYVQILNSGDILASYDVTERMVAALDSLNAKRSSLNEDAVGILYGNMIKKDYATGKIVGKSKEVEYSLRQYFTSTMNHDCCYFRRDLFDTYGLYDENLKIVSDWKWFLQVIGLGHVKPVYVDIDVTIFDASGISETNLELRNKERRQVLEEVLPPAILTDYDAHFFDAEQMNRLRRHHFYWLVYFIERVLFKLEKWNVI